MNINNYRSLCLYVKFLWHIKKFVNIGTYVILYTCNIEKLQKSIRKNSLNSGHNITHSISPVYLGRNEIKCGGNFTATGALTTRYPAE